MNTQYGTEDAIAFLNGTGTDAKGRTVEEYLAFTNEKWEECHDHIQWAFPSHIPSNFNPNAPIVDMEEFAELIADDEDASGNVWQLMEAYLTSLGFSQVRGQWYAPSPEDAYWLTPHNHNYQRISRMLNLMHYILPAEEYEFTSDVFGLFLSLAQAVAGKKNTEYRSDNWGYVTAPIITVETVVYWSKAYIGHL